jgi:hypothetical protein
VFFDGEMRPVAEVATIFASNGKTADFIFRRIGFLLGLMTFEAAQGDELTSESGNRYPCDFDCIIERMPKQEALRG